MKLILGARRTFQEGWISTDIDTLDIVCHSSWENLVQPASVDAMLAEHVFEHLSYEEGMVAFWNCYKFLKPGSYLRAAVPDGFFPDEEYLKYTGISDQYGHKVVYNIRTLTAALESTGFLVCPLEYFSEDGEFHYRMWDPALGKIKRSLLFDDRNRNGKLNYSSIIVDAIKGVLTKEEANSV